MKSEITGVDVYNMTITGGVSMTISGAASDSHHIPTVIIRKSPPHTVSTREQVNQSAISTTTNRLR